jgi:hypothetical protein
MGETIYCIREVEKMFVSKINQVDRVGIPIPTVAFTSPQNALNFAKETVDTIYAGREFNIDQFETGLMTAILIDAGILFKEVVKCAHDTIEPLCEDGSRMKNRGHAAKDILTLFGLLTFEYRTRYHDPVAGIDVYPLDEILDLTRIDGKRSIYTKAVAHLSALFVNSTTGNNAAYLLEEAGHIKMSIPTIRKLANAVAESYIPPMFDERIEPEPIRQLDEYKENPIKQRLREINESPDRRKIIEDALENGVNGLERKPIESDMKLNYIEPDGTGGSIVSEDASENGKDGGTAKTREVKVLATFEQCFSSSGLPILHKEKIVRAENTTKVAATTERINQFSWMVITFAMMLGLAQAMQIVYISDGAAWCVNLGMRLFPDAIHIVDIYHAFKHLTDIITALDIKGRESRTNFHDQCKHLLKLGEIEEMANLIRSKASETIKDHMVIRDIECKLKYFLDSVDRMQYGVFRALGLFIGSGVVESTCKSIVETRFNGPGMRWRVANMKKLIALRCAIKSGTYDRAHINSGMSSTWQVKNQAN